MAVDQRKRQKALAKQAARRKEHKKALVAASITPGVRSMLRQAPSWPIYEILASKTWRGGHGDLVQLVVARRGPSDVIGTAVMLVDLGLLGVKNAMISLFDSVEAYESELRSTITSLEPMEEIDLDLAAKIVRESIAYADKYGFKPHKDYYSAAPMLAGGDPGKRWEEIVFGVEGKPSFVSGPADNVNLILAKLNKNPGPGNYEFVMGEPGFDLMDNEP